jgi:hypothetical protein
MPLFGAHARADERAILRAVHPTGLLTFHEWVE